MGFGLRGVPRLRLLFLRQHLHLSLFDGGHRGHPIRRGLFPAPVPVDPDQVHGLGVLRLGGRFGPLRAPLGRGLGSDGLRGPNLLMHHRAQGRQEPDELLHDRHDVDPNGNRHRILRVDLREG